MPKVPRTLKSVKHAGGLDAYLDEFFKRSPETFLGFVKLVLNQYTVEAVEDDDERLPKDKEKAKAYVDPESKDVPVYTVFNRGKECDNDTLDNILTALDRFEKLPAKKKAKL